MPKIGIETVKLTSLNLAENSEKGGYTVMGSYSLIATGGKVLAKQPVGNGYGCIDIPMSPKTHAALNALMSSYQDDILTTFGLKETPDA